MLDYYIENNMDGFTKIPGLQHISEDIFKFLDKKSLMNCRSTNSSWKNVLDQPIFWLQKLEMEGWEALSKNIEDQHIAKEFVQLEKKIIPPNILSKWRVLSQKLENDNELKEFILVLIKIYNNKGRFLPLELIEHLINANKYPDFLVESILENENPRSEISLFHSNPNGHKGMHRGIHLYNVTSIHLAALYGLTEVVKKLSKKYDDPMVKSKSGINAIHLAALNGHLNIVKHLMGFTDTPLALDNLGYSPIHFAAINGNLDTVKFLVGLTKTPNTPDKFGCTPIEFAKRFKNVEIQKFLENYCK